MQIPSNIAQSPTSVVQNDPNPLASDVMPSAPKIDPHVLNQSPIPNNPVDESSYNLDASLEAAL